jgi:hypothetical protein
MVPVIAGFSLMRIDPASRVTTTYSLDMSAFGSSLQLSAMRLNAEASLVPNLLKNPSPCQSYQGNGA